MTLPFSKEKLGPLTVFLDVCKQNPSILHSENLKFVKDFIEHFGGTVPNVDPPGAEKSADNEQAQKKPKPKEPEPEPEPEPESEESDMELDMTGVIEPDNEPPQKMGNPTLQPTEEEIAESQAKRSEAVSAFVEKDYEKAAALYTEAIVLNPQAALLYAKRGQVYLLMQKPNACIRDCDRALELNPDSAAAHKFRGRALHLLGRFEEAAADLRLACKFDFDEQADEWLREVTPNARKIEEHKRKKERKAVEKAERARVAALKKAREEAKAREENTRPSQTEGAAPGGPGGPGGAGAMPGMPDFYQYLKDPEVLEAFQDPEVSQAFLDISTNPSNILKYQYNKKVMALITKVAMKFGGPGAGAGGLGGMGGMGGMGSAFAEMMGGMAGGGAPFGGAGATPNEAAPPTGGPKPSAPNPDDDVGLD